MVALHKRIYLRTYTHIDIQLRFVGKEVERERESKRLTELGCFPLPLQSPQC